MADSDQAVRLTSTAPTAEVHDVTAVIDGADATTLDEMYAAFAAAWDFPAHFGNNKDAFDDCMRDLDSDGTAEDRLVTVVRNAEQLLADASDQDFAWFAGSMAFYQDDYRDRDADEQRDFELVLVTGKAHRAAVADRWAKAGVDL
ncbi:MAG: barstar family protein [Gordonia sp. (in: high G+C Gram-positive bacteria)]|uniref:barstar family protein n=1 Tax=Gordonia sp. (in: high G+C Gram-positive bacteria) TaxID=84139 RepID=UPI0039E24B3D